jgi:hypothetical protein
MELAKPRSLPMNLELGLTKGKTNTKFAPLVALFIHYRQVELLKSLETVEMAIKTREFTPVSKLEQVLLSILSGCQHLSEVNTRLGPEIAFAQSWGQSRFADQSTLSRTLDELSQTNLRQLQNAVQHIWRQNNASSQHDWRGFLWLDFDLSGLPCGPQAEAVKDNYTWTSTTITFTHKSQKVGRTKEVSPSSQNKDIERPNGRIGDSPICQLGRYYGTKVSLRKRAAGWAWVTLLVNVWATRVKRAVDKSADRPA